MDLYKLPKSFISMVTLVQGNLDLDWSFYRHIMKNILAFLLNKVAQIHLEAYSDWVIPLEISGTQLCGVTQFVCYS